ncbi:hypothetical protein B0H14DRAFT_3471571 [Mycena olivaceomarginata]|nr:hypothetical protein B0H14DRAFT_3471571 [Mycena olivaceomarginata]
MKRTITLLHTKLKERELHLIHNFLETFEAPLWAGRLPLRVGEPAGGSLTADEYKFAVTGPWAMIIPMVWDTFIKEAEKSHEAATTKYKNAMKNWRKNPDATEKPTAPSPRMVRGEELNFLLFAQALKILVGSTIRIDKVPVAADLLTKYLLEFAQLYGADEMKPNHHWAVHIPDQILDFGPVYTFWAFLTEWLNKILKNLNSNNWTGGRLEVSMMREFHRTVAFDAVVENLLSDSNLPELERNIIKALTEDAEKDEALGTIQDAARDAQISTRVQAGSVAQAAEKLSDVICRAMEQYYNKTRTQVHQPLAPNPPPNTVPLKLHAVAYNFALLDGRRITPTSRSKRNSAGSSIQARIGDKRCAGEIHTIFVHQQPGVQDSTDRLLVAVNWMRRSKWTPLENPTFVWDDYPELGVETWELDQYVDPLSNDPPTIIPLADIHCQLCRGRVTHVSPKLWMTITLDRFPTSLNAYGFADITEDSVV